MTRAYSRSKQDCGADNREHQRRSEVGLFNDQTCERAGYDHTGKKRRPEVPFLAGALFEKVTKEQDQREFGNLRWLRREAAELDPTARSIDGRKCEDRKQQQNC